MTKLRKWWDGQQTWHLNTETKILSRTRDGETDYPTGPEADRARKHFARTVRAAANRKERDEAMKSLGLIKCRVNGETIWE